MILTVLDQVYGWIAGRMGDRFLYWCLLTTVERHGQGIPTVFFGVLRQPPFDDAELEAIKEACLDSSPTIVAEPVEFVLSVAELTRRVEQSSLLTPEERDRFWKLY